MSGSSTNLDLIVQSQASKEITANAMFDAASPAMFGGRRASTCTGLTWGYYGGDFNKSDGTIVTVANGTLTLAANSTNRVYVSNSDTVAVTGSTPAADEQYVLYTVVTGASSVTSYSDIRTCFSPPWFSSRGSIDVAAADATLSGYSRRVKYLTITGALTVNRNVIVPTDVWQGYVFNNTSGAYTVTVKTSGGTGVVVGQGKRCILLADGTNVVRITADV